MDVTWTDVGTISAVVALINSATLYVNRLMVRNEIANNNDKLIVKINGTYLKSENAQLRFETVNTRIDAHNARLQILEHVKRSQDTDPLVTQMEPRKKRRMQRRLGKLTN